MSQPTSSSSASGWSVCQEGHKSCFSEMYTDDEASSYSTSAGSHGQNTLHCTIGIVKLPVELLEMVFAYAQDGGLDRYTISLNLSHICKVWRCIALSMPVLWTTIDIQKDKAAIKEHLRRSGSADLDVRISLRPTTEKDEGVARVLWFSGLMKAYSHRIRSFTFHTYYYTWLRASLRLLGDRSKPIELDFFDLKLLEFDPAKINDDRIDPYALCKRLTCRAKHLQVRGFPTSHRNLFTDALISLKLILQPRDFQINPLALVEQFLALSPNLESLQLIYTTHANLEYYPVWMNAETHLPRLKEVVMAGATVDNVGRLFRGIDAPKPHTVFIGTNGRQEPIGPTLDLITKQNPAIERLHLKSCRIDLASFWNLLENLPLLTDLWLTRCNIPWEKVDGLVHKPITDLAVVSPVCPSLTSLTIDLDPNITHNTLIRLIESRLDTKGRVSPINSLICRVPLSPEFDPAKLRAALAGKVPELTLEILGDTEDHQDTFSTDSSLEEECSRRGESSGLDSVEEVVKGAARSIHISSDTSLGRGILPDKGFMFGSCKVLWDLMEWRNRRTT